MRGLLYLYISYFFIYSGFVFILIHTSECETKNLVSIGIQCFVLLLGGILATFVIPANILFIISITCLLVGVVTFQSEHCHVAIKWVEVIFMAVSYGLFKFIYFVLVLDQAKKGSHDIRMITTSLFCMESVCNLVAGALLNLKNHYKILTWFLIVLSLGLFVLGLILRLYRIDSKIINIISLFRKISSPRDTYLFTNQESSEEIISVSKSVILLILLLPFGLCNYQVQYAFFYQSNQLTTPNVTFFKQNDGFWLTEIHSLSIVIFYISLWSLRIFRYAWFNRIYSDLNSRLVIGNVLLIMSTLLSASIETYRLSHEQMDFNNTNLSAMFNEQITGMSQPVKSNISVFVIIPEIILSGISEAFIVPTYQS